MCGVGNIIKKTIKFVFEGQTKTQLPLHCKNTICIGNLAIIPINRLRPKALRP